MAGETVSLTLSMTCVDATTAADYARNLRAAFAREFPNMVPEQTGTDASGNPVYTDDPDGAIERHLIAYVRSVYDRFTRAQAHTQLDGQLDTELAQALADIQTTATVTTA